MCFWQCTSITYCFERKLFSSQKVHVLIQQHVHSLCHKCTEQPFAFLSHEIITKQHNAIDVLHRFSKSKVKYVKTRDLLGVALVITIFTALHSSQKNIISYWSCSFTNFNVSFEKHSFLVNMHVFCFECPPCF